MASQLVATRYELRERIGAGGVAVVYRAFDHRLEREVALKVLRSEYAQDKEFLTRFEREARTAAGLNHPNIVRVDDYGAYGDTFFIAMELVEGTNLKEHVRVRGPLPVPEAIRIARELLSALGAAHARGLVHRDVKPQNVLLDRGGVAKLTDFGIARHPSATQLTQMGTTIGTAAYVAPEQATGAVVAAEADLYGVGLLLYEMLTGRAPFEGDSPAAVLYRQVHEPPRPPRELNPAVPPALEAVVLRALEKDPRARFGSAEEMSRAVDEAMAEPLAATAPVAPIAPVDAARTVALPAVPPSPPPPTVVNVNAPPRRRFGALLPALLAGAALLLLLALLWARPWEGAVPAPRGVDAPPLPTRAPTQAAAVPPVEAPKTQPTEAPTPPAPTPTAPPKPTAAPAVQPTAQPTATPQPTAPPKPTAVPTQPAAPTATTPAKPTAAAKPAPAAPGKTAALTGTVTIEDTAFAGGFRNPGASVYRQRTATWVYGAQTPYAAMTARFDLPAEPTTPARLVVVGLDSEDPPKTPISVEVNGVEVFQGPAPFENDTQDPDFENAAAPWREQAWAIPAGTLRSGTNEVVIRNLADSATVGAPPFFMVDQARVVLGG